MDLATGRRVTPDEPPGFFSVAPWDGRRIVVDGAVWDLRGPRRVAELGAATDHHHPRGPTLVASGRRMVGRWRLRTGELLGQVPLAGSVERGAVDARGRHLVATLFNAAGLLYEPVPGVWRVDLAAGRGVVVEAREDPPADVAIAPDGGVVAVGGRDEVRLFDRAGRQFARRAVPPGVAGLAFGPGGERLAVWYVPPGGDEEALVLLERGGVVRGPVVGGAWEGWWGADLLRRRKGPDALFERVAADSLAVRARWRADEPWQEAWLGASYVAHTAGDGRLCVRDLIWTAR